MGIVLKEGKTIKSLVNKTVPNIIELLNPERQVSTHSFVSILIYFSFFSWKEWTLHLMGPIGYINKTQ